MGKILYRLFAGLYPFIIKIASPFNDKANLWVLGRRDIFKRMREKIQPTDKIIWMHCASLGEFEQGRPLLEKLAQIYPSYKILLTFFSPSGYEVRKNYDKAHYVFYLPSDGKRNAETFFNLTKPELVIFVKYEFWYHYLNEAKKRNVQLLLISGIFRKNQPFFSKYGSFHRRMLTCFTHLFVQNEESVSLLHSIGFSQKVSLSGDTRFDRVVEIAERFKAIPSIESFCATDAVIVAGSTWVEDDKELAHYANTKSDIKFIIAPHNIGKDRLKECLNLYKDSALFSSLDSLKSSDNINTIIIDNIGMLSSLYRYSTVCFVGGGFGTDGVHNVLEAAVYGRPVVFGPEYKKFNEAIELVETGGGISIQNTLQLEATFDQLLTDHTNYAVRADAAKRYVYSKKGSTEKILQFIYENRLLTN